MWPVGPKLKALPQNFPHLPIGHPQPLRRLPDVGLGAGEEEILDCLNNLLGVGGSPGGTLGRTEADSKNLSMTLWNCFWWGTFFGFLGRNFVPNALLTAAAHLTSPYLKMMNLDSSAEKVELFLKLNFLGRGGAILVHHCFSEKMNCFNTKGHI